MLLCARQQQWNKTSMGLSEEAVQAGPPTATSGRDQPAAASAAKSWPQCRAPRQAGATGMRNTWLQEASTQAQARTLHMDAYRCTRVRDAHGC